MSKQESWENTDDRQPSTIPPLPSPLHEADERRDDRRLKLDFETAVPVLVKLDEQMHWGLARNISEKGILIEMQHPPPIGSQVEIVFTGARGPHHASDAVELYGEVRHQMAFNYQSKGQAKAMTAIGVRFCQRATQFNPDRGGWLH